MRIPKTIERAVCHHCFKSVARNRKLHSGKGRVRHKCPHGNRCGAATPRGVYSNAATDCSLCYWEFGQVWEALRREGHFDSISRPTWTELHAEISKLGLQVPSGKVESVALIEAIES